MLKISFIAVSPLLCEAILSQAFNSVFSEKKPLLLLMSLTAPSIIVNAEGRVRHANYIRDLAPYIVDEPPGLLGDDTAPNPSEASLAALGSCVAVGLQLFGVQFSGRVSFLS